jgi:hypothetical protein
MSEELWVFRYIDHSKKDLKSRSFATKEEALAVACAYNTRGHAVTLLEGPRRKNERGRSRGLVQKQFRGIEKLAKAPK